MFMKRKLLQMAIAKLDRILGHDGRERLIPHSHAYQPLFGGGLRSWLLFVALWSRAGLGSVGLSVYRHRTLLGSVKDEVDISLVSHGSSYWQRTHAQAGTMLEDWLRCPSAFYTAGLGNTVTRRLRIVLVDRWSRFGTYYHMGLGDTSKQVWVVETR